LAPAHPFLSEDILFEMIFLNLEKYLCSTKTSLLFHDALEETRLILPKKANYMPQNISFLFFKKD